MASTAEGAGVALAYEIDEGVRAPPVLLVHDIASDRARAAAGRTGAPAASATTAAATASSGAPEPYVGTTVMEQAEDAAALLRALGLTGAVVVGVGFGGADRARPRAAPRRARRARSSPPTRRCTRSSPRPTRSSPSSAASCRTRWRPAARTLRSRRGSRPTPMPARSRAPRRRTRASSPTTPASPRGRSRARQLRSLTIPVTVVTSPSTPWHVARAAEAIAALVPGAQRREDGDVVAAATRARLTPRRRSCRRGPRGRRAAPRRRRAARAGRSASVIERVPGHERRVALQRVEEPRRRRA